MRFCTVAITFWLVAQSSALCEEIARIPSALVKIVDSVSVAAPQRGRLTSVPIREGDLVKKGESLARTDDRLAAFSTVQAKLNLQLAKREASNDIGLRLARKKHDVAVKELERAQRINAQLPASVSDAEVLLLKLAKEQTALEIEQVWEDHRAFSITAELRQSQVEQAELEHRMHRVLCPISGMVVAVEKREGEWVDVGQTIARVVRVDRVRAEGFLKLASSDLVGLKASFELSANTSLKPVLGEVVFVSPEANPVNGEVQVWVEFPNADFKLRPGFRGTVIIHDSRAESAKPLEASAADATHE